MLREVFHYPDDLLYQWFWLILTGSTYVTPHVIVNVVRDDPDDNKLLACAVSGHADYVVSEDKDLHRIGHFETISVISKQQLLAILDGKSV